MSIATLMIRALRHPNYRLFFTGQSISLIGTWLTRVATSWLVYKISGSALMLGVVGFFGQLPTFLITPFAGVWVDRWDRHRVLVVTQVLSLLQSFVLAALTLAHVITVPQILVLNIFQGMINAFDMPGRQAFVVDMIEDVKDLPNAIALNSSMVNMARLVGPSIAGILIATLGEGGCFAVDTVSYLAVICSLLMMRLPIKGKPTRAKQPLLKELSEGFHYASTFMPLRSILLLLALVSFMGVPYMVLLPIFAAEQLHGGPNTLGYLTGASGLGALIGVLYLASRQSVLGLGEIITFSAALFGFGLIGFSQSKQEWSSLFFMLLTGMGMMVQMAASNTVLQTLVDEDKRGRVMSLYTLSVAGMIPFGSLMSGYLAESIGASGTILLGGVACVLGSAVFLKSLPELHEQVRPVYLKLGITS